MEFFELSSWKKNVYLKKHVEVKQEESDQVIGLATVLNLSIEQGTAPCCVGSSWILLKIAYYYPVELEMLQEGVFGVFELIKFSNFENYQNHKDKTKPHHEKLECLVCHY